MAQNDIPVNGQPTDAASAVQAAANKAAFEAWLKQNQAALAQFTATISAFLKAQSSPIPLPTNTDPGLPQQWHAGTPFVLDLDPITDEEISALTKGYAEAEVVEKAIQRIMGFIEGVMFVAG